MEIIGKYKERTVVNPRSEHWYKLVVIFAFIVIGCNKKSHLNDGSSLNGFEGK